MYNRGSEWRKWDLHFHTPSSYDYKDRSVSNVEIIETLCENKISVVAITDHHLIDKSRICELQQLGKEKNITILPGIEFCSELGGSEAIHFIGIFAEDADLDTIWTKIQAECNITPGERKTKGEELICCEFKKTCNLIKKLGGLVTIHAGKKSNSVEGIKNNLLVKQELKQELLSTFHPLLEIGQISDKESYEKIVFPSIKFTLPIIMCSDNHNINEYLPIHPLWIKADPTFEGLKQVLNEPSGRIYIGAKPAIFDSVESARTKYIDKIEIHPIESYSGNHGSWFDNIEIEINKELVAVIGNKGNGKSALTDIIAHCSNYPHQEYFSFLNSNKFRSGQLANNFEATVTFADGSKKTKGLGDSLTSGDLPVIKYMPQGYFETICNDLNKEEKLREEIENIVFQYIEPSERLGASSFKELIRIKSEAVETAILELKKELSLINSTIISLEDKENPAYRAEIQAKIAQKEEEIKALIIPEEVVKPQVDDEQVKKVVEEIDTLNERNNKLDEQISNLSTEQKRLAESIEQIKIFIENTKNKAKIIEDYKAQNKGFVQSLGIDIDNILSISLVLEPIDKSLKEKQSRYDEIKSLINLDSTDENNLYCQKKSINENIRTLKNGLDAPSKRYQEYLKALAKYNEKKKIIEGDKDTPETLLWYKNELSYIDINLHEDIQEKYKERTAKAREIYQKKKEVISIYLFVKQQIDSKIKENKQLLGEYDLKIEASFGLQSDIISSILHFIKQNVKGSFKGKNDGEIVLRNIIKSKDLMIEDEAVKLFTEIIEKLKLDGEERRFIGDQVTERIDFYEKLFSLDYLTYNYHIMQGSKNLSILSPGEKGALLLVFYLLLDMDNSPLILDQPEDNLDNDSVANILVDFIKQAKQKRQIIMVTHNPNLAVVADAEQVIYVSIDKKDNCKVSIESGSIENPKINKHIVDVLEGAMPAFRKRDHKYLD
ncbi:MAG: AAA family ATPase [Paludibacteraceae bacterium]|nr:AAA family ATPase [Paludibacteraceae bacterium]